MITSSQTTATLTRLSATAALPMSFARFDEAVLVERDAVDGGLDAGIQQLHDEDEQHRRDHQGLADAADVQRGGRSG